MIKYKIGVPKNLEKNLEKTPGLPLGTTAQVFCCQFRGISKKTFLPNTCG